MAETAALRLHKVLPSTLSSVWCLGYWVCSDSSRDNIGFSFDRNSENGPYSIVSESGSAQQVYCHMEDIPGCGGGGWTLAMKIDGNKVQNARLC